MSSAAVQVITTDVNLDEVSARVTARGRTATGVAMSPSWQTGADVQLFVPDGWATIDLDIHHPDYHTEKVRISLISGQTWLGNNPVCRVRGTGQFPVVRVTLGRIKPAPIKEMTQEQLKKLGAKPTVPPGLAATDEWVPLAPDQATGVLALADKKQVRYDSPLTLAQDRDFWRLSQPVLDSPHLSGWSRLHREKVRTDLRDGRFYWVEYGGLRRDEPRLALAVWAPRYSQAVTKADFVVFYHPNTIRTDPKASRWYPLDQPPFRGLYPYGIVVPRAGGAPAQPYMNLGYRYFSTAFHLLRQLLAANRRAVFVMPIAPAEKTGGKERVHWEPFASPDRLHRILRELSHFLHRESLTTPPVPVVRPKRNEKAGGSLRDGRAPFMDYGPLPAVGTVASCGFSAGSVPLLRLAAETPAPANRSYPDRFYASDTGEFYKAWRELWDLDAANLKGAGIALLVKWLEKRGDRQLRLYQTAHTKKTPKDDDFTWREPPRNQLAGSRLLGKRKITDRVSGADSTVWATEVHDDPDTGGRWSAVVWSTEYLKSDQFDPTPPPFQGSVAHVFALTISVGHAASLSTLERWPGNPRLPPKGAR